MTHQRVALAVMIAFFALAPAVIYPLFLMKVMCFALFACAFNLLIGYGGLLSFGHAMFFGSAGYISAHAAKVWGFNPEFAILAAVAAAALLGLGTGLIAIRRQGIYFAMITLALAQMVFFFCVQAAFTGGEDGIQAVPRGRLFGLIDLASVTNMYVLVFAIFVGGFLLIYRIIQSPFGQVLKAIRENEPRAISLGFDTDRYKLLAFVLSAALAGLAGGTKALVFQLASLTDVHWTMSGEVVLMTLVGGLGTVFGPVVGALVIVAMANYLAQLGAWVTVVQGAIFVVCVLMFRRGVIGEIAHWLKKPLKARDIGHAHSRPPRRPARRSSAAPRLDCQHDPRRRLPARGGIQHLRDHAHDARRGRADRGAARTPRRDRDRGGRHRHRPRRRAALRRRGRAVPRVAVRRIRARSPRARSGPRSRPRRSHPCGTTATACPR